MVVASSAPGFVIFCSAKIKIPAPLIQWPQNILHGTVAFRCICLLLMNLRSDWGWFHYLLFGFLEQVPLQWVVFFFFPEHWNIFSDTNGEFVDYSKDLWIVPNTRHTPKKNNMLLLGSLRLRMWPCPDCELHLISQWNFNKNSHQSSPLKTIRCEILRIQPGARLSSITTEL